MNAVRRKTRGVKVGSVPIGGDAPIVVQSMTTTATRNIDETVGQIQRVTEAGCEVIRVAVVDEEEAECLKEIKAQIKIPLIADIHYNYRLALLAAPHVDCIRINPGNIGDRDRVEKVVAICRDHGIPIRIGVNAGSLEQDSGENKIGQDKIKDRTGSHNRRPLPEGLNTEGLFTFLR